MKIQMLEKKIEVLERAFAASAGAFDEDRDMAYEAGMNGYLAKPIQIHERFKTIGSLL